MRFKLPALGIACALGLPLAAYAQPQATTSTSGTSTAGGGNGVTTAQLKRRVDELQQEVAQLKQMIEARQAATPAPTPASAPVAQPVAEVAPATPAFTTGKGLSMALHGFVSATAFEQSKSFTFGNGQNAEFPVPRSNGSISGADVRNTRFWLDFTGAKFAGDWTGGGRIEMDFFGGFNGTGPYSQQQAIPRLRQAYLDLDNANTGTKIRIGQQWELMFPLDDVPVSLSHIAFPLGFASGMIGWRFPGVVVMQDLNHGGTGVKWRLDMGAFEGSWSGPGDNVNFLTAGSAGFRPQLEARLRAQGGNWVAYVAGHFSEIDLRGVGGTAPTPVKSSFNSTAFEAGGKWTPGTWVLMGTAYTGRGIGEIFGSQAQFGDIRDTGAYAQLGKHFTPHWSAYAFYGESKSNTADVIRWMGHGAAGRLKSQQAALSLEYNYGPYAFGAEWMHVKLHTITAGLNRDTTSGNQLSLSAIFHF
ncbi:MAG TPA: hypothetical protein VF292_14150 [Rhodanobacteraceae bacterium]